jgi:uncharacterized protein
MGMKPKRPLFSLCFILLLLVDFGLLNVVAQTVPSPGNDAYPAAPAHYFNDYAGVTKQTTQASLDQQLADFDKKTSDQVVVAIFKRKDSTAPLADYCKGVFNKWGVGQKGSDNGVVLFVFIDDHLLRIATGRGMNAILPDDECKRIIDTMIVPEFRNHDFDKGLSSGIDAILSSILAKQNR